MSTNGTTSGRAGVVAAAWAQGGAWRIVAVAGGATPRVVGTESVTLGDAGGFREACERLGATRVIGVAKASSCVAKAVELPAGSDEELASALGLMSEAELPGSLPPYRCAGGALPGRGPGGLQPALLLGLASVPDGGDAIESWTGEAAALAFLVGRTGCGVVVDRGAASVASVSRSGEGWLVRGFRAGADDPEEWREETSDALGVAARHAGVEAPALPTGSEWVWLDQDAKESLRSRVSGVSLDEQWFSRFAVPLGAALGAAGGPVAAGALFGLRVEPPRERRSALARASAWLADPAHALVLILVCAVVAAAAPLAAAWVEREVLRARVATIQTAIDDAGGEGWLDADRRAALYDALKEARWPMTKLSADLARALPVGADIEFLEIKTGDAIMVRGYADSLELVNTFAETLNNSGVFRDFVTNNAQVRDDAGSGRPIEFELRGQVGRPYVDAAGIDDFADNPLAVRMYGERGRLVVGRVSKDAPESAEAGDAGDGDAGEAGDAGDEGGGDGGDAPAVASSDTGGDRRSIFDRGEDDDDAEKETPLPEPLTEEALAGMDRRAVTQEWISRKTYLSKHRAELDDATIARLEEDIERGKERLEELKNQ